MNSRLRFLVKFSWRNLGRHPWRTIIMGIGLCFGTGYIIFALNFSKSGSIEIVNDFLKQYSGFHQVVHERYYPAVDKKNFDPNWTVSDAQVAHLAPEAYVRRTTLPVYLSGPYKTLGALLTGLEIEREIQLSKVATAVVQGRFLSPTGERELVLGERLARKLGLKLGDEVALIGQAIDGSVANDIFTLVGLLSFGGGDMEEVISYTSLKDSRNFAVIPEDRFHQYVSFDLKNKALPAVTGASVVSWELILPEIAGSIEFIDRFTWIVSAILVMVISLGLGNTLMITFLEREKEFNALNVIGARSNWVMLTLVVEVIFLGLLGIGSGILLGYLITWFFNVYPINLLLFTGGKPIMMGGIAIIPRVRLFPYHQYAWQAPLMVASFLALSLVWPLYRVIQRSRRVN